MSQEEKAQRLVADVFGFGRQAKDILSTGVTPLEEILSTLTPREQLVLRFRYGLTITNGIPQTLKEVGLVIEKTKERVRQIQNKALRKLRHPTRSRILKQYIITTQ